MTGMEIALKIIATLWLLVVFPTFILYICDVDLPSVCKMAMIVIVAGTIGFVVMSVVVTIWKL